MIIELQIDRMLGLVQNVHITHDAGKDIAIWEERPLWNSDIIPSHLTVLSPLVNSAHEGIYLKGKPPARGILVV